MSLQLTAPHIGPVLHDGTVIQHFFDAVGALFPIGDGAYSIVFLPQIGIPESGVLTTIIGRDPELVEE